jgi:uncharacterized protein
MTGLLRRVGVLLASLAALALAATLGAGWLLARPVPAVVGDAPQDLEAETVSITGGSGGLLRGWFAPGRAGVGAVLLLHGVRANRTAMLGRARTLHREGYGVLLVDFQAHGETPGRHITFGALESIDARAAATYLRMRAPGERLGVIGVSLGGAAALLGSKPLSADAMVLEAVYPTIEEATANRLRLYLGPLGPALTPLLIAQLGLWGGINASALRPIDAIPRLSAPLLMIVGAKDTRTPLIESQRLFDAARSPKELWIVPGADHEDFQATHRAEYDSRVERFLRKHLRTAG